MIWRARSYKEIKLVHFPVHQRTHVLLYPSELLWVIDGNQTCSGKLVDKSQSIAGYVRHIQNPIFQKLNLPPILGLEPIKAGIFISECCTYPCIEIPHLGPKRASAQPSEYTKGSVKLIKCICKTLNTVWKGNSVPSSDKMVPLQLCKMGLNILDLAYCHRHSGPGPLARASSCCARKWCQRPDTHLRVPCHSAGISHIIVAFCRYQLPCVSRQWRRQEHKQNKYEVWIWCWDHLMMKKGWKKME